MSFFARLLGIDSGSNNSSANPFVGQGFVSDNINIEYQDWTGNWRLGHVCTTNNAAVINFAMSSVKMMYPGPVRAVNAYGAIVGIM